MRCVLITFIDEIHACFIRTKVKQAVFEQQLDTAQKKRLDFLMKQAELFAHFVNGASSKSPRKNIDKK